MKITTKIAILITDLGLVVRYNECLIALMDEAFFSAYEIRYEVIEDENGNKRLIRV